MRVLSMSVGCLVVALAPTVAAQNWTLTSAATAADGSAWDQLGFSVALSGDTLVLGAPEPGQAGPGAAYVFEHTSGVWSEVTKLTASDGSNMDDFGHAVAVDGDAIVVGADLDSDNGLASGSAYVFERHSGGFDTWGEVAKLSASDPRAGALFGYSLSLEGTVVAVGAPHDSANGIQAGAVYMFARDESGRWTQIQKLTAEVHSPDDPPANDNLGLSVALRAGMLVAGAPGSGFADGAAHVFERERSGAELRWTETQRITPAGGPGGLQLGRSVALSEDALVFGTATHPSGGAAYVFGPSAAGWVPLQKLTVSAIFPGSVFGSDVSVSGSRIAIGDQLGRAAYVFERDTTGAWNAVTTLQPCSEVGSHGFAIAVSEDTIVAGAPADESNGFASGAAYVYESLPLAQPVTYCTAGVSVSGCRAQVRACGIPSAAATSGFSLGARDIDPNKKAFFFYGANGRQAVQWGNGTSYQCVVPPVKRTPFRAVGGLSTGCGWSFSEDLAALWASQPGSHPGAGATVQAQLWLRDAFNTSNRTSSLSDAVEFTVTP